MSEIDWSTHDRFYEALGWMHAECCAALDIGEDPRGLEVGEMVYRCIRDLAKEGLTKTEWTPDKQAVKTLESMGYTYHGGEYWKPPLGKKPDWLEPEWVDGLPPVGCECEFRYVSGQWGRAKVDYIGRQVIVFTDDNGAERTEYRHNSENFRPIQTPGQRMREELAQMLFNHGLAKRDSYPAVDAILKWMKDNNLTER